MEAAVQRVGTGFPARYRYQVVRETVLPLVALALAVLLPLPYLIIGFVVTGQAHFLITYVYQYRGGRMTPLYLMTALALLALAIAYFVISGETLPILLFTGALFSAHFARDEMTLHDEALTRERVSTICGFVFIFTATLVGGFFPNLAWMLPLAAGLVVGLTVLRLLWGTHAPSYGEGYLWLIEFIAFLTGYIRHLPGSIIAIIILLHVTNWYIAYGLRLAPRPERARRYWFDVAWTLALSAALFACFSFGLSFLSVFFLVGPYYAWSIAHITLSYVAAGPKK